MQHINSDNLCLLCYQKGLYNATFLKTHLSLDFGEKVIVVIFEGQGSVNGAHL